MAWLQDLPLELFISILDAVIHTTHPKDHSTNLKTIVLVSKEWNDISQSISSLWLTLSSADPPAWVERVLHNSSPDGPLNVRFVRYIEHRFADRWFERRVVLYIARWVDFHIGWPFVLRDAVALSTWAPRLQRLSAYCTETLTPILDLLKDQVIQHQSLSLENQLVPGQARSTSLQRLFIYKARHHFLSITALIEMLISCPNLVQLVIHEATLAITYGGVSVVMAHLTHIDLQLPVTATVRILQRLQLPAVVKFSVVIPQDCSLCIPVRWTLLLEAITPVLARLIESETKSLEPRMALQISADGWVLKIRSGSFVFGTPYHDGSYLKALLSLLGDVPAAVVCNVAPRAESLFDEVFAVQGALPNIVYLRLPGSDYADVYRILSRMATSARGLFVKLRTLELSLEPELVATPDLLVIIEKLMEARGMLVIRNRYPKVEVGDGLGELRRKFPNSLVDGSEVGWWDRPEVPMDPDYEEYVGEEER